MLGVILACADQVDKPTPTLVAELMQLRSELQQQNQSMLEGNSVEAVEGQAQGSQGAFKMIVVMTDGRANRPSGQMVLREKIAAAASMDSTLFKNALKQFHRTQLNKTVLREKMDLHQSFMTDLRTVGSFRKYLVHQVKNLAVPFEKKPTAFPRHEVIKKNIGGTKTIRIQDANQLLKKEFVSDIKKVDNTKNLMKNIQRNVGMPSIQTNINKTMDRSIREFNQPRLPKKTVVEPHVIQQNTPNNYVPPSPGKIKKPNNGSTPNEIGNTSENNVNGLHVHHN